jgi:acylphosphatase
MKRTAPSVFLSRILLLVFAISACSSLLFSAARGMPQLPPRAQPNPNPAATPGVMKMRVDEGRVTGEIQAVPIQQVLEELAARTGIVFEVPAQENDPVSITFYKVTVQEAVQRLVGASNSMIYYTRDETGTNRIQRVRIFSSPGKNPQPSLRYIGTGTVTKTGDDTVDTPDQALKVLAESKKVDLRQKAVEVLVAAKGDAAVQALTQAVNDTAPEVRVAAIEGLATLGARSALPQILKSLRDPHPGVRQSAIVAVALMGDAVNVKDLRPLSKDPDASVAAAADTAIKKLATRRPGPE